MIVAVTLEAKTCPSCGLVYAVASDWMAAKLRQHDRGDRGASWYCPNGHEVVFAREGDVPRLQRELDRAKQENARLEEAAIAAQREARAAQAEVKRTTRRAIAGVCPCCNRTFRQLTHHMRAQHPEQYAAQIVTGRAKGGKARAAAMTPEARSATAKRAANARWRAAK